ncbi:hypothetical protein LINGRAHAP2_LOCUS20194, partial [Linum grandiflorum]
IPPKPNTQNSLYPNPPFGRTHPSPTPQPPQPILPTSTHTLLPPSKLPYNSGNYSNHLLHLQFSQDDTLSLHPAFQDDPLVNRCFYS